MWVSSIDRREFVTYVFIIIIIIIVVYQMSEIVGGTIQS